MKRKPLFKIESAVVRKHGEDQWRAVVSYTLGDERTTLTSADSYDTEDEARAASEVAFAEVERKLCAKRTLGPSTTA